MLSGIEITNINETEQVIEFEWKSPVPEIHDQNQNITPPTMAVAIDEISTIALFVLHGEMGVTISMKIESFGEINPKDMLMIGKIINPKPIASLECLIYNKKTKKLITRGQHLKFVSIPVMTGKKAVVCYFF